MKSIQLFTASMMLLLAAIGYAWAWGSFSNEHHVAADVPDSISQVDSSTQQDDDSQTQWQTDEQALESLKSFRRVNDHPLFEMRYVGSYDADRPLPDSASYDVGGNRQWACSIFVSYTDDGSAVYGRNFDWFHNPAMVLHTNPEGGYASISLVDVSYLGFEGDDQKFKSVDGRQSLLGAPMLPFDGMNEHGLTVGMAAVGDSKLPRDPDKTNVGSLQVIRLMLDGAKTVDEALEIFSNYNIVKRGGPNIHYLIADVNGNSALVELIDGKSRIQKSERKWQSATNFYVHDQDQPLKQCWRFAKIDKRMKATHGELSVDQTFQLLKDVAQNNTQWSVAYDMANKKVIVSTDRDFEQRYSFGFQDDSSDERP